MVVLTARQQASGQTTEAARAHVLAAGEFGVLVVLGVTYLVVGDGTSTVGALIDAGKYFVQEKDLPA